MTLRQLRDSLTSDSLTKVPFNRLLGMRLHGVHRDGITIDCTLRDDLRNSAGVLEQLCYRSSQKVLASLCSSAAAGCILNFLHYQINRAPF